MLLFLGFLAHICSRNMVKSVEKLPSKKKVDVYIFYLIYTYIRKKSSFALNLTFSNSVIFRVPDPYMFQKYG